MNAVRSKDPHWDLVIEIAATLWVHGEHVVELDPLPTQRFVDLQWAARQAGRILGGRAEVLVSPRRDRDHRVVRVTITYVAPGGRGHQRAEEGLETLMRMVLEQHAGR